MSNWMNKSKNKMIKFSLLNMLKLIYRTCVAVFEQFGLSYAGESKNTLHCVRTQVV